MISGSEHHIKTAFHGWHSHLLVLLEAIFRNLEVLFTPQVSCSRDPFVLAVSFPWSTLTPLHTPYFASYMLWSVRSHLLWNTCHFYNMLHYSEFAVFPDVFVWQLTLHKGWNKSHQCRKKDSCFSFMGKPKSKWIFLFMATDKDFNFLIEILRIQLHLKQIMKEFFLFLSGYILLENDKCIYAIENPIH